jgi:hypothetical protein
MKAGEHRIELIISLILVWQVLSITAQVSLGGPKVDQVHFCGHPQFVVVRVYLIFTKKLSKNHLL